MSHAIPGPKYCIANCYENGICYPGHDITNIENVTKSYQCQDRCNDNVFCLYWTFNTMNQICWLKDHKSFANEVTHAVSGPRYWVKSSGQTPS